MKVTVESEISGPALEQFGKLYQRAFEPLRTLSAARQVLNDEEFAAEMTDPRVDKYVAWDQGEPIGLGTLTRELETVPWISPEYYRARYPEHAARNAIFYLGFTLTHPERRQAGAYAAMVKAMIDTVADADGVCGYDVSAYLQDVHHYTDNVERFVKRRAPAEVLEIDRQTYFAADFAAALDVATLSGGG